MGRKNIDIVQALDKLRVSSLYVHNAELEGASFSSPELKERKVYLVETLAVINALVERGTMLLYGGHGGGKTTLSKYLGRIFCKLSKDDIEKCILRGHPELTEEKILGSLDLAQMMNPSLMKDGKIEVKWNDFVRSHWKIIDEINRLTPYAQNILLSLLAEGSVKYHDQTFRIPPFTLFATMNPKDEGNFELSLPFKDRFAIALPITMPDYDSFGTIGKKDKIDSNLHEWLRDMDLNVVQDEVNNMRYTDEADLFINYVVASYRLCERISKESSENLSVDKSLCVGCHFHENEGKVCFRIKHPLSVRVKEDLRRYGKALAWLLGDERVEKRHIALLAPYMIWHRSILSKRFISEFQKKITGDDNNEALGFITSVPLDATKVIISLIDNEFDGVKEYLIGFEDVKKGALSKSEFNSFVQKVKSTTNNFLILTSDIVPILENKYVSVYDEIINYNERIKAANAAKDYTSLNNIKNELAFKYNIPNRQYLYEQIVKNLKNIQTHKYRFRISISSVKNNDIILSLFKRSQPKFPDSFEELVWVKLLDFNEDDCDLTYRCIDKDEGNGFIDFEYHGEETNNIYQILKELNG